jgi:GNAT superfamily N-acetyltransferase
VSDYRIRAATVADAVVIARHRVEMFRDMGVPAAALEPVRTATEQRVRQQIAAAEYHGWLVELDGAVVAGAGVLLHQYHPSAPNPLGRPTAYILNVYTEPDHRRHGLARRLMNEILAWCVAENIPRASLHASEAGRSMYEQLGFVTSNELRLDLQ